MNSSHAGVRRRAAITQTCGPARSGFLDFGAAFFLPAKPEGGTQHNEVLAQMATAAVRPESPDTPRPTARSALPDNKQGEALRQPVDVIGDQLTVLLRGEGLAIAE